MSFKDSLPQLITVAIMSVAGGIYANVAYHKGLYHGFHEGYDCGKKYGRLDDEIDAEIDAAIKAQKTSGKKEEASK